MAVLVTSMCRPIPTFRLLVYSQSRRRWISFSSEHHVQHEALDFSTPRNFAWIAHNGPQGASGPTSAEI